MVDRFLSQADRKLFVDRAIDDAVIRERGAYTETDPRNLASLGFAPTQRKPGVVLPFHNVLGSVFTYQLRPHEPRVRLDKGKSKIIKYENPPSAAPGQPGPHMGLDVPKRCCSALGNPGIDLFIVEGAFKADAAASAGLCSINVSGVFNWRATNDYGGKTALADWENVALNGRRVYLAFDSDVTTKPQVRTALFRLKAFLESRMANVLIVLLPQGDGDNKTGLDDYLAAGHTTDELRALAVEHLPESAASPAKDGSKHENQATKLVELLNEVCKFFHDGDDAYASFTVKGHRETFNIRSTKFRHFASRLYYRRTGSAPNAENVAAALNILSAQADEDGEECQVHLRTAHRDGITYIDTGNAAWEVIEVSSAGRRIIQASECPVRFRRCKGMLALPTPERGGKISELREFVNVANDHAFILLVMFMIAVLLGMGPYPILLLIAEKGSAKTTLLKVVRALLDPHLVPIRALSKDERDFAIACENNLIVGYDNVSFLPGWQSDAMCRCSTGAGFGVRQHYADREEELFIYCRPQMLASIKECAVEADFKDRALEIALAPLTDDQRRTEKEFWAAFDAAAPAILGTLLDGASYALGHVAELQGLPRMADFAQYAIAAVPVFGWKPQEFLAAYKMNTANADEAVLETSLVVPLLPDSFDDTATALLEHLNLKASEQTQKRKAWPKSGWALSNHLRKLAANLRSIGIAIEFARSNGRRGITIRKHATDEGTEL